jgi:hypothetical protein
MAVYENLEEKLPVVLTFEQLCRVAMLGQTDAH